MDKFKVGDKVLDENGNRGRVYEIRPSGGVVVYFDDGTHDAFKEELLTRANSCAVNSTRAIVQKALNAISCNTDITSLQKKLNEAYDKWFSLDEYNKPEAPAAWKKFQTIAKEARRYGDLYFGPSGIRISKDRLHLSPFKEDMINAKVCNIGNNPNYKPEEGMKFLASHFDMFDMKKAKEMIDDAKKNGVKIPDAVITKAKKAGIWNSNSCVAKNSDSSIRSACRSVIDSLRKLRSEVEKDHKSGVLPKFYLDEIDACLKKIESVNSDFS